jgi:hypothetical protein
VGEDFNYDDAKARIKNDLVSEVNAIWGRYKEHRRGTPGFETERIDNWKIEDKARAIIVDSWFMPDSMENKRISMLLDIVSEFFWRATAHWSEVLPTLSNEKVALYSKTLVAQAQLQSFNPLAFGHAWLVERYDDGILKEHISQDLLKESMNKGFWEIANYFYDKTLFASSNGHAEWKMYSAVMKYSQHLDLTRCNEFSKGDLYAAGIWPDETYIRAYEKAKDSGKLSAERLGFLARPIVEQMLEQTYQRMRDFDDKAEQKLERALCGYSGVLHAPSVQNMLKEHFSEMVKGVRLRSAGVVERYLDITDSEKRELASSALGGYKYENAENIMENGFPKEWLTEKAKAMMAEEITKEINKGVEINYFMDLVNLIENGRRYDLFDDELANERISGVMNRYLEEKRRPKGDVAKAVYCVDWPDYADPALVKKIKEKAMSDMLLRRVKTDEITVSTKTPKTYGVVDGAFSYRGVHVPISERGVQLGFDSLIRQADRSETAKSQAKSRA